MHSMWTRREFLGTSSMAAPLLAITANLGAMPRGRMPFKLGIITDEITEDLDQALDFISSYGLHYGELRKMWGKNIMNVSRPDLDHAKHLLADYNIHISDIGSPIFKWNLPQVPARPERHDEFGAQFTEQESDKLLMQSFELAYFFGTQKVRIFSYWRVADPEKAYPYVRDRLAKAAALAGKNDILLVLENEHECNIGTGKELGRILKDINSPRLQGNWDPGNSAMLGEVPYPDGYENVKGLFAHMHAKDVTKDPQTGRLKWAPVGGGFIDWKGQIKAVLDQHYEGTFSLETHYRRPDGNKIESTGKSLLGLLKIIHEVTA